MNFNNVSFDFNEKLILVIGGSRGIGKGIVDAFIHAGAKVFYASRNPIMNGSKNGAIHVPTDLTKNDEIDNLFREVDSFGPLDVLVNSAAINYTKKIEDISEDEWEIVIKTNLSAVFYLCKKAITRMKKQNSGKIINISSIAGRHRSLVSGVHYVSSKAGLIGLTKQLAFEVAEYNININATCPSQTMTDMLEESMTKEEMNKLISTIPLKRFAKIKEQVGVILFLASDAASYITGTYIDVNGGQI